MLAGFASFGAWASSAVPKVLMIHSGRIDARRLAPLPEDASARIRLVQALGPARGLLPALWARGCQVLSYLPEDAYLVALPAPDALDGLTGVGWMGAFRPDWKRAPGLARLNPASPQRLRVVAHPGQALSGSRPALERLGRVERLSEDLTGTGHARLAIAAGRLRAAVARLTALESVSWVAPAREVALSNDDSTWVIQGGEFVTSSTPLFDHGLIGTGQVIAVADSGLDSDACQFRYGPQAGQQTLANATQPPAVEVTDPDHKVITYYLLDGASPYDDFSKLGHGTHVAGCAAGDNYAHLASGGDPGRDAQDGMAPGARLVIQDTGRNDGVQAGLPASLVELYQQAHDSGARIHNNAFGMTDPETGYGADSREVDEAAWRMPDMLIVYSAGNLGPGAGTLDGIGSTSKNSLVVGASLAGISNQGRGVCHFSSQGPTADGRLRPDLVAPGAVRSALETDWIPRGGTDIFGQAIADSTTDPPNDNCVVDQGLRVGTSFSAPLVAGGAALVRQYFADGLYPSGAPSPADGFEPSAALLKAMLVNAAESITGPLYDVSRGETIAELEPAPTDVQGWGLLRLDRSLFFRGDPERLAVLNDCWGDGLDRGAQRHPALEEGEQHAFGLVGVRTGSALRISLAWIDPAGTAGAGRSLVNDLDLELEAPDQTVYKGNIAFSSNRSQPAGGQAADDRNPVEQVIVDPGIAGDWTVRVLGRSIPGNGRQMPYPSTRQGYALVAVGDFAGVCLDPPCQPEPDGGGPDGEPDADAGGGGDPSDGSSAQDPSGSIAGGCGCGSERGGPASPGALVLLWVAAGWLAWRRTLA